ncbi:hypothetical protein SB725_32585, partial [Pseudomonas sp. SIMBA_041]
MPPAHTETATSPSLLSAWRQQVVNTPWLSAGLGLSLLAVVVPHSKTRCRSSPACSTSRCSI